MLRLEHNVRNVLHAVNTSGSRQRPQLQVNGGRTSVEGTAPAEIGTPSLAAARRRGRAGRVEREYERRGALAHLAA